MSRLPWPVGSELFDLLEDDEKQPGLYFIDADRTSIKGIVTPEDVNAVPAGVQCPYCHEEMILVNNPAQVGFYRILGERRPPDERLLVALAVPPSHVILACNTCIETFTSLQGVTHEDDHTA